MHLSTVLLFLLSANLSQSASEKAPASSPCLPLSVGDPGGNYFVPGSIGEIPYSVLKDGPLFMDAYIQPGTGPHPGVMVVHGGGWVRGSRVAFISQFLELLTESGFNWFSIDYRLAPSADLADQLSDIRAAFRFIECHSEALRTDASRLAILGEEAGGHLAALVLPQLSPQARAAVIVGGVFDLVDFPGLRDSPELAESLLSSDDPQILRRFSPLAQVSAALPDTLLVHGSRDSEVTLDQARQYCEQLTESGSECQLLVVEGGIRRAENWLPSQWDYKAALVDWLRARLGRFSAPALRRPSGPLRKNIEFARYQSPDVALKLDAFVPDGEGPFSAVILVHGGGWEAGDKSTYLTPLLAPLSRGDLAWFSIDYRLTPEFRNWHQLEDVRRAVRFVRFNAADFRIDPDEIALLGESAGGQLALQVAAESCGGDPDARDPIDRLSCRVQAVVSLYGVYDFVPMVKDAGPRSLLVRLFDHHELDEQGLSLLRRYSPLNHAGSELPPALLIHGTDEFLWEQAETLAGRLGEVGAPFRLIRLEGAPHGMENWEGVARWQSYKAELVEWLKLTLRPSPHRQFTN